MSSPITSVCLKLPSNGFRGLSDSQIPIHPTTHPHTNTHTISFHFFSLHFLKSMTKVFFLLFKGHISDNMMQSRWLHGMHTICLLHTDARMERFRKGVFGHFKCFHAQYLNSKTWQDICWPKTTYLSLSEINFQEQCALSRSNWLLKGMEQRPSPCAIFRTQLRS